MKENRNNFNLIKKIGTGNHIATGADSDVYHVATNKKNINLVAKEYTKTSFNSIDTNHQEEVLRQYYADTEKAKKLTEENPNPLNQSIIINNDNFSLNYQIISQGPIILEREKNINFIDKIDYSKIKEENRNIKTLFGQKYIEGKNISELPWDDYPKPEIYAELYKMVDEFFAYLSEKIGAEFTFAPMNIKYFFDTEENKINLIITDLASSMLRYYGSKSKFKL